MNGGMAFSGYFLPLPSFRSPCLLKVLIQIKIQYIIAGLASTLAAWKVYCALVQFAQPFSHGAHTGYSTTFSYTTIMTYEWISAACFVFIGTFHIHYNMTLANR